MPADTDHAATNGSATSEPKPKSNNGLAALKTEIEDLKRGLVATQKLVAKLAAQQILANPALQQQVTAGMLAQMQNPEVPTLPQAL